MKRLLAMLIGATAVCITLAVTVERSSPKDTIIPAMKFGLTFNESGVAKVESDAQQIPPCSAEWAQAYKGWSTLPPVETGN